MRIGLIAAFTLMLSACVSYSSNKQTIDVSVPSEGALQAIEPGVTTVDWLLTHLGEPDVVRRPDENVQIWQYENIHSSSTRLRAFPIIAISSNTQKKTTFNFEVSNNQILRYWKDDPEAV
ncbi:MAG: hypothetical protein AAF541_14135 [Pseudomonadota bacterium]